MASPQQQYEPLASQLPHQQVFSLDVTALSDRLNVLEDELLCGLRAGGGSGDTNPNTNSNSPLKNGVDTKNAGQQEPQTSGDSAAGSYAACVVVSERIAITPTDIGTMESVLGTTLRQLLHSDQCTRIVVCGLGDLYNEVEAVVRRCKRAAAAATSATVPTAIHLLQGENDHIAAVQYACMYLEATAASSSSSATVPLVILEMTTRVFDLETISELVHQLGNATILTDGLTRAVVLMDSSKAKGHKDKEEEECVGIWVCAADALVRLADSIFKANSHDQVNLSADNARTTTAMLHHWVSSVLGPLHCEKIIATPEFNWAEISGSQNPEDGGGGRLLVRRFDEMNPGQEQNNENEDGHADVDAGSRTLDLPMELDGICATWTTISAIQAQLDENGVEAALFPIQTTVSHEPRVVNTSTTPEQQPSSERTPLLSEGSGRGSLSQASEVTMLSEVDLEDPHYHGSISGNATTSTNPTAHAFVIQVNRPVTNTGLYDTNPLVQPMTTTELILALPQDLHELANQYRHATDDASSDSGQEEEHEEEDKVVGRPVFQSFRRDRLPSAVRQVTVEAVVMDEPPLSKYGATTTSTSTRRVSVILHIQKQVPAIGYVILITALCAVSSQGAVLNLLVGVPPMLKLFWRVFGASLVLLPFAGLTMYKRGLPTLSRDKKWLFLGCCVAYATYNAAFLVALSLTSIGHVYIFGKSHSLIMVIGKLVMRQPLGALELVGAALGAGGGVLTAMDHGGGSSTVPTLSSPSSPMEEQYTVVMEPSPMGDLVAFAGAFAGVAYLLSAKKLRAALGVRVFLFFLTTGVWMLLLPILVLGHERLGITLWDPTDPHGGIFGWVHHLDIEAYIVLVGSICGTMGFIASMKYFEPLVISVTMLTEPVAATVISIFVGVASVPGWPTFVGGAFVILGCVLVLLASHKTSTKIDVSDRLIKTPFPVAAATLRQESNTRARHATGPTSSSHGE